MKKEYKAAVNNQEELLGTEGTQKVGACTGHDVASFLVSRQIMMLRCLQKYLQSLVLVYLVLP